MLPGPSLAPGNGGYSLAAVTKLLFVVPFLWSMGSRCADSVAVFHWPSFPLVCRIFLDQGSNPCPLHLQAEKPKHLRSDDTRGQCSWGHVGAPGSLGPRTVTPAFLSALLAFFFSLILGGFSLKDPHLAMGKPSLSECSESSSATWRSWGMTSDLIPGCIYLLQASPTLQAHWRLSKGMLNPCVNSLLCWL